jgi:hypothetical protein
MPLMSLPGPTCPAFLSTPEDVQLQELFCHFSTHWFVPAWTHAASVQPKSGYDGRRSRNSHQNLQAQFPVQSGYRLAEGFRLFLRQAGAVVKIFGAERSRIGQQADDPLPNQG